MLLSFGAMLPDGVSAGTPATSAVSITDDDVPSVTVSFGAASYTVAEGSSRTVTVTLDADSERTVVIPIEAANQGGATTTDYSGVPQNVTFDSGDTSKSFTFMATEDSINDDGESVLLAFGALPGGVSAGTPNQATVSITDDDVPSVTVSFGSDAYTVAEGGTQQVTLTLSADPERTVVIPIEAANQGGATTADYSGVPQNVTFDSGDTSKSFTFTAEADAIDDDGESVLLAFGALPGGVSAGTPNQATVSITDDDVPSVTVSFGSDAYTVAEGGTQQVTVTLSADPEHTVVIPIEAANQGGASGSDYSGVPQSVTFDSGDTSKTFTVTAAHDTVDDDGESVLLSFGATLPDGVSAGTPATSAVTITDDDVPAVTVSFGAASYTVAEGSSRTVTVTLDADPKRTVVIPIEAANEGWATSADYSGVPQTVTSVILSIEPANEGRATSADYSGVPQNVTFGSGDTEKTFVFTAETDTVDDDGESVLLSFGATLPDGVSAGTPATSTVTITDDDDVPSVTVSFGSASYTVAESDDSDTPDVTENTVEVTLTLDADPERTVVIPIEAANEGGATSADYSGVPQSVTFNSGDTEKTFVFTAETDTVDDDGESVLLSFDTMPDARVSEGSPSEAMVTIRQDSTPSTADCNSAVWCADLEFRTTSAPNEMWFLDSKFLDSQFHYGDATYRFGHMHVAPYGHNIPINGQPRPPFAIPERTKFYFSLHNMNASGYDLDRFRVPNDDWMDWTLHISTTKNGETLTAVLPLSEARFGEGNWAEWSWSGSDLEALRAAWTEGQVYKLKIVEDPRSQRTPKVLGPPLYLKVDPSISQPRGCTPGGKCPRTGWTRAPPDTTYKVQWKEATGSWDNPADVSEEIDSPAPATNEIVEPHHPGPYRRRGVSRARDCDQPCRRQRAFGCGQWFANASAGRGPGPGCGANSLRLEGAPSHRWNPRMWGRRLSAVTTGITDVDGLQECRLRQYQWLADDVEIIGSRPARPTPSRPTTWARPSR